MSLSFRTGPSVLRVKNKICSKSTLRTCASLCARCTSHVCSGEASRLNLPATSALFPPPLERWGTWRLTFLSRLCQGGAFCLWSRVQSRGSSVCVCMRVHVVCACFSSRSQWMESDFLCGLTGLGWWWIWKIIRVSPHSHDHAYFSLLKQILSHFLCQWWKLLSQSV